jgi:hypothetical protein
MSEWWTYTLSDFLMFSPRIYWRLVEQYNRDVWPLHGLMWVLGLGLPWLAASGRPQAFRAVACLLALGWLWVGWAFHWQRYAGINSAAPWLAGAFFLQAVLLAGAGMAAGRMPLQAAGSRQRGLGGLLVLAGLLYPLLGLASGRPWAQAETLGLSPEPTALFTLGLLLLGGQPVSRAGRALLFLIPLLSLLVGAATAWTFRH